jgi:hypothetical protein
MVALRSNRPVVYPPVPAFGVRRPGLWPLASRRDRPTSLSRQPGMGRRPPTARRIKETRGEDGGSRLVYRLSGTARFTVLDGSA